jgi:hypothetical protein
MAGSARRIVLTRDFGIHIQVRPSGINGHRSKVSVEQNLGLDFGLGGFWLRSSGIRAPTITAPSWPLGLKHCVDDRLANDGARTGRVLGIWQGTQPVALCSWHLHEFGPPVIYDLGCRAGLPKIEASISTMVLLLSLRQIAANPHISRDTETLRWADHPVDRIARSQRAAVRGAVRGRASMLGFSRLGQPPKWLAGRWAAERRF